MAGTACHAAMKNVSNDCGLQPFERFFVFENSERVEQSLRWMFMHAIARVDYGDVEMRSHQVRGARRGMTHHNAIGADRAQCVASVEHRFAFLDARARGLYQGRRGSQRFGGEFKGRSRTSRRFVKQKYDALAAQQRTSFLRIHAASQLEQAQDFLRLEMLDPEQRTASRLVHRKKGKPCIIRGRRAGRKVRFAREKS